MYNNLKLEYYLPTKILCEKNIIDRVGIHVKNIGKNALLITGKSSMKRLGYLDRVKKSLEKENINVNIYQGIPSEPHVKDLNEISTFASKCKSDFVIALGGGSVLDTAKAIAVASTHPGNVIDYLRSNKYGDSITDVTLPIIAIPSTSGSGSEVTCYSILNNEKETIKDVIQSEYIYPTMCIIDPEIPANAPNFVKLRSGLDVLAQAFEGYISKKASPFEFGLGIEAINMVFENLDKVLDDKNDIQAHAQMAIASAMAGIVIAEAGTVAGHAIAHAWGAASNIPHGTAVGALLPLIIKINRKEAEEKLSYLTKRLSIANEDNAQDNIDKLILKIEEFYKEVGFSTDELDEFTKDILLEDVAKTAIDEPPMTLNPYPITEDDIVKMLNSF